MAYLLDSGIVLRLVDTKDVRHTEVRQAVRTLGDQGQELFIATQNIAEFCNVATRPILNNGLGLQPSVAIELFEKDVEPICEVVVEKELVHLELKRLISTYQVSGKQVHDARLVAMMLAWQIESILTLNDRDFRRYEPEGIKIVTPAELIATP
jgi:predicted nucleic acid-binding protein